MRQDAASKIYAGIVYGRGSLELLRRRRNELIMHPETRMLQEKLLILLRDRGEKKTLAYMRWLLKHPGVYEGRVYSVI